MNRIGSITDVSRAGRSTLRARNVTREMIVSRARAAAVCPKAKATILLITFNFAFAPNNLVFLIDVAFKIGGIDPIVSCFIFLLRDRLEKITHETAFVMLSCLSYFPIGLPQSSDFLDERDTHPKDHLILIQSRSGPFHCGLKRATDDEESTKTTT